MTGGFGGFGGMGSMGGMGDFDFEKIVKDAMPNMGGFGMNGFYGMGGFPGAGGSRQQQPRQQRPQERKKPKKPQNIPPPFTKGEESGVAVLTKEKFPDSRAKYGWLILFYDKNDFIEGHTTQEYVSMTKNLSKALLDKAQGKKNGMAFKVGAVDCSGDIMNWCKWKLEDDHIDFPTFITVFNGKYSSLKPVTNYDF